MKHINFEDISAKVLNGLQRYAGFSLDSYCCNDNCPNYIQEDRAGCGKGGYAFVNNCPDSLTLNPEYFKKRSEEAAEEHRVQWVEKNQGSGI